jgi:hypothetical protein
VASETYLLFVYDSFHESGGTDDLACDPFAAEGDEQAVAFAERVRSSHKDADADWWELDAVSAGSSRRVAMRSRLQPEEGWRRDAD